MEDGAVETPETYYKQMRIEVDRLTRIVNDLFDLSRTQAGSFQVDREMVALDDIVSDCIAALAPLASSQEVRLTGRSDRNVAVVGDGRELSRAVTNLVANAIRHTRPGGSIEVRVSREDENAQPRSARIEVTDECGGIPEDDLPRVFDVGFRGESARTPDRTGDGGGGFGLAIVRGIVQAHDGTIAVENVGGGCRFTIDLPTSP